VLGKLLGGVWLGIGKERGEESLGVCEGD